MWIYRAKLPSSKSETQYTGHTPQVTLNTFVLFSPSLCRCVEIIAKEGRSLKELYLVSCKITDHGRILSITVPLLQSNSNIMIITIITHSHYHDSGLIWFYNLPLMRLANSKNVIEVSHEIKCRSSDLLSAIHGCSNSEEDFYAFACICRLEAFVLSDRRRVRRFCSQFTERFYTPLTSSLCFFRFVYTSSCLCLIPFCHMLCRIFKSFISNSTIHSWSTSVVTHRGCSAD